MRDLMIVFTPYLGIGIFTGVNASEMRHWRLWGFFILAAVYAALAAFAYFLATKSRTADGEPRFGLRLVLSPTGWGLGFTLAFVVGLTISALS